MKLRKNRYSDACDECNRMVDAGTGYVLRQAGHWITYCKGCLPEGEFCHDDIQCEHDIRGSRFVEQIDCKHPHQIPRCPNPKLPGLLVCGQHATKDVLVAALMLAHKEIDKLTG